MRIVFLNSLERKTQEDRTVEAQIWIGEDEGIWHMGWNELESEGQRETIWFEGASWSEMLLVYRHRLAAKLSEGFRPIIDGIWDEREIAQGRGMVAQRLICYSELHPNEEFYAELVSWRRRKASMERKAPYLIASNRLLKLISVFCPHSKEELLQLPGVGENKANEYGAELVELSKVREQPRAFPLDWVEERIDDEVFRSWVYKQKEAKYRAEMEKFSLRRKVLECLAEGQNISDICLHSGLERREALELLESLEKDGYQMDDLIKLELQSMPEQEQTAVWQAFEELGDNLLKPVLLHAFGAEAAEDSQVDLLYERLRLIRLSFRRNAGSVRKAV
ncbi:HRDC domain-containing protein [Paenibacillus motobuensis]|uniref:HRDC domain-containing protein n=1 Tax=Paenibacillus TaxID=44249 RepID=UPI00203D598E|nr:MULTISPECIES: HRDC domain-containing protein [Paenibacillus]MCM3038855.1 HRDC domain-containing protein [Paenibacillus lutimineralis]MCM3645959.1 HRDC domain-containing protein [Paenibacillus motobuensis]